MLCVVEAKPAAVSAKIRSKRTTAPWRLDAGSNSQAMHNLAGGVCACGQTVGGANCTTIVWSRGDHRELPRVQASCQRGPGS